MKLKYSFVELLGRFECPAGTVGNPKWRRRRRPLRIWKRLRLSHWWQHYFHLWEYGKGLQGLWLFRRSFNYRVLRLHKIFAQGLHQLPTH